MCGGGEGNWEIISTDATIHQEMTNRVNSDVHVLLVDDNPELLDITSAFLRRECGISVIEASDVDQAKDTMKSAERYRIDCVVSDYRMDGKNGLDFLEWIRIHHPELPFILLTGRGDENIAEEALAMNASGYVQKGSTEQYAQLWNRIREEVSLARKRQQAETMVNAMEQFPLPTFVISGDEISHANQALSKSYGEAIEGVPAKEAVAENDRHRVDNEIRPAIERKGWWMGTLTFRTADGTELNCFSAISQISKERLAGMVLDVNVLNEYISISVESR